MPTDTFTHRTASGHTFTRTSAKPFAFVIVGTRPDDSWDGRYLAGSQVVLSWRAELPTSFGAREFSAFANVHAERINDGDAPEPYRTTVAGAAIDARAREIQAENGCSYADAVERATFEWEHNLIPGSIELDGPGSETLEDYRRRVIT